MKPCAWCGLLLDTECPNPAEHDRLDRESETTWRREALRPVAWAVLAPDVELRDVA